jgi:hypothetical protein
VLNVELREELRRGEKDTANCRLWIADFGFKEKNNRCERRKC